MSGSAIPSYFGDGKSAARGFRRRLRTGFCADKRCAPSNIVSVMSCESRVKRRSGRLLREVKTEKFVLQGIRHEIQELDLMLDSPTAVLAVASVSVANPLVIRDHSTGAAKSSKH